MVTKRSPKTVAVPKSDPSLNQEDQTPSRTGSTYRSPSPRRAAHVCIVAGEAFDKDGNQWKERGAGTVKLLKHKVTGEVRIVMRQAKTLKICASHLVLPSMPVQEHAGNDKTFIEKFQEVVNSQSTKEESEDKDASAAAGLLDKLSVEEKKTEDVSKEKETEEASKEETLAAKEEKKSEEEPTKSEEK
uniref:RanBD1 domain-containing protein n=1 Tax=Kalanchoe fedtschenkoi TaxID=63787 RepID=A0A7N0TBQ8_KALFE